MKILDLLGQQLKDSDIIDFLELDDLEVIYSFDRLHENQPDEYFVAAHEQGIEMIFSEHQILETIFFYIEPEGHFHGCDPNQIGMPTFSSRQSATKHAESLGATFELGEVEFLGTYREWIKMDFGTHFHHLEFRQSRLHKMTAMRIKEAEQGGDGDAEEAV